jgi:DNA repair ATPase RecN
LINVSFEGSTPQFQKEVQARVGGYELDRSYNDNPEELQEKKGAVEAIIKTLTVRMRNGLPYHEALDDMEDKLGKLAREMDKKYVRPTAARELKAHAQKVAPEGGWESAYDLAINEMKEGASLEKAKKDLEAMLRVRSS